MPLDSYDLEETYNHYEDYYTKKSSALRTFYEYNGCYPEGYEMLDDSQRYTTINI